MGDQTFVGKELTQIWLPVDDITIMILYRKLVTFITTTWLLYYTIYQRPSWDAAKQARHTIQRTYTSASALYTRRRIRLVCIIIYQ